MKRRCLWCERTYYGRSDKRFCEDTCRTAWHNHRRRQQDRQFQPVWRQLRKNYQVLVRLYHSADLNTTDPRVMRHMGYDFTFHTSCDQFGNVFCFDYGYRWLDAGHRLQIIQGVQVS